MHISVVKIKNAVIPSGHRENLNAGYCLCVSFVTHTKHFTSDSSGRQMCGNFSHNNQFSETSSGCPIIKLNADTFYLETVSDSTG